MSCVLIDAPSGSVAKLRSEEQPPSTGSVSSACSALRCSAALHTAHSPELLSLHHAAQGSHTAQPQVRTSSVCLQGGTNNTGLFRVFFNTHKIIIIMMMII